MRTIPHIILLLLVLATTGNNVYADAVQLSESQKNLSITTIDGNLVSPLNAPDKGVCVVIFITTDCPIANGYQPTIKRLVQSWSKQPVKTTLVHVRQDLTEERALDHRGQFQIDADVVIDKKRQLVDALQANVTPEAFVINRTGQVVYRGRIDNWFAGYGRKRTTASQHDLADAVNNSLAGNPIAESVTKPIGCFIPK